MGINYSIVCTFIHITEKRSVMLWSYSSDANDVGHAAIAVSLDNAMYTQVYSSLIM